MTEAFQLLPQDPESQSDEAVQPELVALNGTRTAFERALFAALNDGNLTVVDYRVSSAKDGRPTTTYYAQQYAKPSLQILETPPEV